jgi:hypothetical protein
MHPKTDFVESVSKMQTAKMQDIVDNIRAIHGDKVGGKMCLIGNLINQTVQMNTTMLGLFTYGAETMEPDMMVSGLMVVTSLIEKNKAMSKTLFITLFEDDKKLLEEMKPFFMEMTLLMKPIVESIMKE